MLGRNPGLVTTQGERLAELLADHGYPTIEVSSAANRYVRLADIVHTVVTRRDDYDVMLLQIFSGPSFVVEDVASWLAQRLGKSLIMVMRGGGMPEFIQRFPRWSQRVLSRADLRIAPSPFLARVLNGHGLHTDVIPNVIDLSAYRYRHRPHAAPRLLWMRSFHHAYNPQLAVRSFARVRARFPEATLVMAGPDHGEEAAVRTQVASLGLSGAVRFAGFLDMAGKMREGAAADVFINTNRIDNMPVSVVEACALGLPVVATGVGGLPDLLRNGETGLLVPDDDDAAMAAAICRLVDEPALTSRLSERGREIAVRSSWDVVRPQWLDAVGRVFREKSHVRN